MEALDEISIGVFSYLKANKYVAGLDYKPTLGANTAQLGLWEQARRYWALVLWGKL